MLYKQCSDRQIMGVFSRSFARTDWFSCDVFFYGYHHVPPNIEPEFAISDTGAPIPHSLMAAPPCQGSEALG